MNKSHGAQGSEPQADSVQTCLSSASWTLKSEAILARHRSRRHLCEEHHPSLILLVTGVAVFERRGPVLTASPIRMDCAHLALQFLLSFPGAFRAAKFDILNG